MRTNDHAAHRPPSQPSGPRRAGRSARWSPAVVAAAAAVLLVSVAGLACRSAAEAPAPKGPAAAPYEIAVTPAKVAVKVGATVNVTLRFTPHDGHHWNEEYPAKVTFPAPAGAKVTAAKATYSKAAGDFVVKDGAAAVTVRLAGKQAGAQELVAKAKFSVCNDTTCLIENKDIPLPVRVTP